MTMLAGGRAETLTLRDHQTVCTKVDVGSGGQGRNVAVFVHSALLDRALWNDLFADLSTRLAGDWTLVAYDLRGHGTAREAPAVESIDQLAQDLIEVVDAVSDGPAHLVGLSLGGAVVQAAALSRPDRVASLVPIGTSSAFPRDIMRKRAELTDGGVPAELQNTLNRWFTAQTVEAGGPAVDYVEAQVLATTPAVWSGVWLALGDFNVTERLPSLTMPLLAIGGEADGASPPAVVEKIAQQAGDGRLVIVAGASHLVALEQPARVAEELVKFLAPVSVPSA